MSLLGNADHSLGAPTTAQPVAVTVVVALAPVTAVPALENLAGLIVANPDARTLTVATADAKRSDSVVMLRELNDTKADGLDLIGTLANDCPLRKRPLDTSSFIGPKRLAILAIK